MNALKKRGQEHASRTLVTQTHGETQHVLQVADCLEVLGRIPDGSVQLIVCDPPYNINVAGWDNFKNYGEWAAAWLAESVRVLSSTGSIVLFGGLQFQSE